MPEQEQEDHDSNRCDLPEDGKVCICMHLVMPLPTRASCRATAILMLVALLGAFMAASVVAVGQAHEAASGSIFAVGGTSAQEKYCSNGDKSSHEIEYTTCLRRNK